MMSDLFLSSREYVRKNNAPIKLIIMPTSNTSNSCDEMNILHHLQRGLGPPPPNDHLFSAWGIESRARKLKRYSKTTASRRIDKWTQGIVEATK
mmetsp:Transcript_20704/g.27229  ORF Transcript_20704/g.27229 Transcript_20704/m.27229 type:complete len:94 (-) Transcript_20704:452-733(-)